MAGTELLTRERIILHTLIQICWHEFELGRTELIIRPFFSVLGFLGYTGLLYNLLAFVDFLEWDHITSAEEA